MPENFIFPEQTLVGCGKSLKLIPECFRFGVRGVIIHGRSLVKNGGLEKILDNVPEGIEVACWEHSCGEPSLENLEGVLKFSRKHSPGWIAGVGGGSVLDIAKACAGLFNTEKNVNIYHDGAPIERPGLPFIAVPTTAGTGSEATINSVLTNIVTCQKKSIRNPSLIARLVILDPVLLKDCPSQTIAYAGLDAFTQAVEAYTSRMATWLSDQLGLKAIALIAGNLEKVYREDSDESRQNLLIGSYLAGLSFSMARLGVVHGLAHPLGIRYHAAHGLVCGICLPYAVELNRAAMGNKYEIISKEIGCDLLTFTRELPQKLGVESPFKGQRIIDSEIIIRETLKSWSTAANSKPVTGPDVEFLLARLFADWD